MKGSAKRKCLCCGDFYPPDHRNVRHQRYCSKPVCRKESTAQSQRRWLQTPENQNYFRGPENRQRVKDWRKANPGYWRKKKSSTQVPLQDFWRRFRNRLDGNGVSFGQVKYAARAESRTIRCVFSHEPPCPGRT